MRAGVHEGLAVVCLLARLTSGCAGLDDQRISHDARPDGIGRRDVSAPGAGGAGNPDRKEAGTFRDVNASETGGAGNRAGTFRDANPPETGGAGSTLRDASVEGGHAGEASDARD